MPKAETGDTSGVANIIRVKIGAYENDHFWEREGGENAIS